jgi:hypothetical protein
MLFLNQYFLLELQHLTVPYTCLTKRKQIDFIIPFMQTTNPPAHSVLYKMHPSVSLKKKFLSLLAYTPRIYTFFYAIYASGSQPFCDHLPPCIKMKTCVTL